MDHSGPFYTTPGTSSDDDLDVGMSDLLPPNRRQPPPTQEDWDRIQPIFTELYIDQGRRLKDVQRILLSRHNFHATPKMYKSRITKWKLKKYVKSADKENIVRAIQDHHIDEESFHRIKFNGRPARLDLVRRYCKKTGAHPDLANALPTKALEAPLRRASTQINTNVSTSDDTETPPSTMLTPSPIIYYRDRSASFTPADLTPTRTVASDPAESVAWHVQQYMEWQLAPIPSDIDQRQQELLFDAAAAFQTTQTSDSAIHSISYFELLLTALDHFDVDPAYAWTLISQACDMARVVVQEQHRGLLRLLIVTFTDDRWSQHSNLRRHVLDHLAEMAATVLGEDHELASILRSLKSEQILESAAIPILKVSVDVLTRQKPALDEEVCEAKRALMDLLRRRGDFIDATLMAREMCAEAQGAYGKYHEACRQAIRRLGDTYVDQGDLEHAREAYREVLSNAMNSPVSSPSSSSSSSSFQIDEATIFSLQALCQVDKCRGALDEDITAEEVIETVLSGLGTSKQDVMDCLARWSQPLTLRQRWLGSNRYSDRLLARWSIIRS
ncbi:uncharacterized protein AB675_10756 [Cyphellophora attinorum]|uniref:Clr5 domain-containing protein n=1 Tax=Cyphellophora attinorum TaxID=1664694 RepID=A0A0N0NMQ5_9EURO|nr:uncharacterized protein AB675_10756 [Phialophora attinorum]KPI40731.1 hypothetical protein AB675_10756 [Phialophora attinorum]